MAISELHGGWSLIRDALKALDLPLHRLKIFEFGDQRMRDYGIAAISKQFWERLGATCVSIDLKGKRGALAVDWRFEIGGDDLGTYNLLTNFGSSEHTHWEQDIDNVSAQKMFFLNMHNVAAVGAVMVHDVPHLGGCYDHGFFHYTPGFFNRLADANGYEILRNDTVDISPGIKKPCVYCTAILRKTSDKPFNREEFPLPHRNFTGRK